MSILPAKFVFIILNFFVDTNVGMFQALSCAYATIINEALGVSQVSVMCVLPLVIKSLIRFR